jgi:hypothetical protein
MPVDMPVDMTVLMARNGPSAADMISVRSIPSLRARRGPHGSGGRHGSCQKGVIGRLSRKADFAQAEFSGRRALVLDHSHSIVPGGFEV